MEKEQAIGRISLLDAMRGYFIAWVGLFNTLNILNAVYPNAYYSSILLLINDKGWFCLSAIFGYSFGLLLKKQKDGANIFLKRMLILFLLGMANSLLYYGDILKDYALIGMLIYGLRKDLIQYPVRSLLFVLFLVLLALVFVENDMSKAGSIKDFRYASNVFWANVSYTFHLNGQSYYYLITYHLEMLLLVLIGFYGSYLGISTTYLWVFDKAVKNFRLYLGLDVLMLFIFVASAFIPWLNRLAYFSHIFLFSLWYMTGFYLIIKPQTSLHRILSNLGRKTLTIYILQNVMLCSFWFVSFNKGLAFNSLLFLGLQMGVLGVFFFKQTLLQRGGLEGVWRKVAEWV